MPRRSKGGFKLSRYFKPLAYHQNRARNPKASHALTYQIGKIVSPVTGRLTKYGRKLKVKKRLYTVLGALTRYPKRLIRMLRRKMYRKRKSSRKTSSRRKSSRKTSSRRKSSKRRSSRRKSSKRRSSRK